MKNVVYILLIFVLFSCGDEDNNEENISNTENLELAINDIESAELTENERNLKLLLREKELSLTNSEKLREIAIKSNGDYKRLACLFKCSPSVIKRLINESSFATQMAIDKINESYDFIVTKGNDLDYINDCSEVKWTNKIFGNPKYLEQEDSHILSLNDVWETVYSPNQETLEEAQFSVNKLKLFELESNEEFQKQLIETSQGYFEDAIEDFFDQEYGVNGSLRELKNQVGKTEDQRLELWEARIKHYFSSIGYMGWVQTEVDTFSSRINRQRKLILESGYNFTSSEELKIKNHYLKPFNVSDEIVVKAKKQSEDNLEELFVEGVAIALTLHPQTHSLGKRIDAVLIVNFVVELGQEIIFPSKDDTKALLTNAYKDFINNLEFSYSDSYNANNEAYYNQLMSLIENRQNEKIKI